jgi:adenine deaminase
MRRRDLIDVALGNAPADAVVEGGTLVNVATAEIYPADIAIKGDRIAATGDVAYTKGAETTVIDAGGRYLTPGLVDGHLHQYHSYIGVNPYVESLLLHGVTATADGFYGPGIIGGVDAVRFFKEAYERMPIRLIFLVPTLSWVQNRALGLTPASGITPEDMLEILSWDGCYGLEEPPFFPVIMKYDELLDVLDAALEQRKVITGHASGISARELQAYVAVGTYTDHESVEVNDAVAKARAGMRLLMRQGSGCTDVPEVVRSYTERGIDPRALAFCADVASPEKLVYEGTIDHAIRVAIAQGVPPVRAIQMATLNVAEIFYAQQDIGVIAPGRYADILLVNRLVDFSIDTVIVGGAIVVRGEELRVSLPVTEYPASFYGTVKVARPVTADDLTLEAAGDKVEVRVIGVTEGSLETDERRATLQVVDGAVQPDLESDVLRIAMIDRLGKGTGIGLGFVQGFKLRRGAIGSTANAVCENLILVGTSLEDMAVAANALIEAGGGKVVVDDGKVVARVEMPLLGLHSDDPLHVVMEKFSKAFAAIASLGCELKNPFSQMEFCFACGEIGDIKLSEEGLLQINPPKKVEVVIA